ncbi:MAG: DUF89 family protein [Clostridia bacterium]|nr:DUF89 family protein [Clostridia bacterium]
MSIERLNIQCVFCLLNKHLKNIPNDLSNDKKLKYMQGILKIIGNADISMSAPEIVEQISEFKQRFGETTDYTEIKSFYNSYLLKFENEIEANILNADNSLEAAVKYAMAGNYIDFGALEEVDEQKLRETLDKSNEILIDRETFKNFEAEINNAKNIVYLTDNCGEIVLDKLLIKQILKLNNKAKINVIVRGKPVLNDCTLDDAKQVGLDKLVTVTHNGTSVAGTVLNKISQEAKTLIDSADLIISKGQGNFETLHHCGKNIYYLFLCKCDMFAKRFGVEKLTGIFINDNNLFL